MIEIGKYNKLTVIRSTPPGMYLGFEGSKDVALLPNKYVPEDLQVGDEIEVFIYNDTEDRIIATTLKPKIQLHEFGCLEVTDVNRAGAFLDWGLEKELMLPYKEQYKKVMVGDFCLVYLYLDNVTDRLVATSKINQFLETKELSVSVGQKVDLLIGDASTLGVNVIINNIHKGLIYHNEIFQELYSGDRTTGYIKNIREDNKIDVSLQQQGLGNIEPSAAIILEKLQANNGFLPLTDNSDPADILELLQMSKKTFKKAIGSLYKDRMIVLEEKGIRLKQ